MTTARNVRRLEQKAKARSSEKQFKLRCPGCQALLQKGLSHGRNDDQIRNAASSVQLQLLHMRKTGCKGIAPPPPLIPVEISCESCGEVFLTEERNDALAYKAGWIPAATEDAIAFRDRAIVARRAHMEATGCDGGPDPGALSPGQLSVVAPDELDAVGELFGVSRKEAAEITADAFDLARDPGGVRIEPASSILDDIAAMSAIVYGSTPARLDEDKTAQPKTQLRTHVEVPDDDETHTIVPGGADTHVDLETGKKTPLGADPYEDDPPTGWARPGEPGYENTPEGKLAAARLDADCAIGSSAKAPRDLAEVQEMARGDTLLDCVPGPAALPPGSFRMAVDIHKAGDKDCCVDIGRRCECGGRVHMQSITGGIAYHCELCGSDRPGSR